MADQATKKKPQAVEPTAQKTQWSAEDKKLVDSLKAAGFRENEFKFFVEMAKRQDLSEKNIVWFAKAFNRGVPESDFKDFMAKKFPLFGDQLYVRYGFTPEDAANLSKTKAEANKRPDFNGINIDITNVVNCIQRMETQGDAVRTGALSSPRFARIISVNDIFGKYDKGGETEKKIMDYYNTH